MRMAMMLAALATTVALGAPRPDLLVSGAQLAELSKDPGVVVIHVAADPAFYQRGHLPGARFLPLAAVAAPRDGLHNEFPPAADMVKALRDIGVGTAGRIVLYGEDAGIAAARAFVALDYLGAGDRSALLDGGVSTWRADGRALTAEVPRVEPGTFAARPRPELLVSRQAMADLSACAPAGVRLVDARPGTQFAAGHVPGALSFYWGRALRSPEQPTLLPPAELAKLYAAAGVQAGDVLYHYCNSGMQASLGYFIARYLGFEARLYDGSMGDWTAAGLPVATAPIQ
ncbi:MAG: sulfurtransferase [Armatimonadetes bacterium]|nr:sulfurtransferase [Armatimonadota bacterium]